MEIEINKIELQTDRQTDRQTDAHTHTHTHSVQLTTLVFALAYGNVAVTYIDILSRIFVLFFKSLEHVQRSCATRYARPS